MQASKRRYSIIAMATIVTAAICAGLVFLFTPKGGAAMASITHYRTATALLVTITSVGGSILFLGGIKQFKTRMQIAYILLAVGFILFGLALLQLPVIGFLDLWDSWFANSGMLVLPFIFSTGLIYAGMREFARLEGIRGKLTSAPFVATITLLGVIVSFLAGHWFARYRFIAGTDQYIAIVAWSGINVTFATLLAYKIVGRIGPFYQSAMRWLFIALLGLTCGAWHEYTINFFTNNSTWYVSHGLSFIPFIISGLLIMRAGYAFALLGSVLPIIPVHKAPSQPDTDYSASLNSIASLVSNIEISKRIVGNQPAAQPHTVNSPFVPATTKASFVTRYKMLEHYLMHEEPLRSFKQEEIRGQLSAQAREALKNHDVPGAK